MNNSYIAMKDCSFKSISGDISIKKDTILEKRDHLLFLDNKPICAVLSQNGRDYFCPNDISSTYQYTLASKLINLLTKPYDKENEYDEKEETRYKKVWEAYNNCESLLKPSSTQEFPYWQNHIREQPIGILTEILKEVEKANV